MTILNVNSSYCQYFILSSLTASAFFFNWGNLVSLIASYNITKDQTKTGLLQRPTSYSGDPKETKSGHGVFFFKNNAFSLRSRKTFHILCCSGCSGGTSGVRRVQLLLVPLPPDMALERLCPSPARQKYDMNRCHVQSQEKNTVKNNGYVIKN